MGKDCKATKKELATKLIHVIVFCADAVRRTTTTTTTVHGSGSRDVTRTAQRTDSGSAGI